LRALTSRIGEFDSRRRTPINQSIPIGAWEVKCNNIGVLLR
jgi:hypothetical protein